MPGQLVETMPPALAALLVDAAPDGILAVDRAGRIRYVNRAVAQLFQYLPEEILGREIECLIPQRFHRRHRRVRREFSSEPRSRPMGLNLDLLGIRRDGVELPVEVSLSPVVLDGEGLVIATLRDVSERRRTRELLQRSERLLATARLAEQALRLVDPARFANLLLDTLGEHLALDHAMLVERGVAGRGLRITQVRGSSQEVAARLLDGFLAERDVARLFDAELARLDLQPGSRGSRRPERYLAGSVLALHGPSRVHGLLVVLRRASSPLSADERAFAISAAHLAAAVHERQHQHALLLQATKMEALGQLTGGVAHDFNNLLTVISGNLQVLAELCESQPDWQPLVDAAARAAGRGAELTAKLLAFSRKRAVAAMPIDCRPLIEGMAGLVRRTVGEGIRVQLEIDEPVPLALGDPGQLESALLNLVINARDAMAGGGQLVMRLRRHACRDRGELVSIEVADSGEGMAPDTLQRAFEPFFTTKPAGKGTGLGLSMVYGFVRQWGGDVQIESERGVGTLVRLCLPLAQGLGLSAPSADSVPVARGSECLLLVEDDPEVAQVTIGHLRALGYKVLPAADIASALALLRSRPEIAMLLSDVMLADGETGFQLAEEVARLRPELPMMFCSGYADSALERHFPDPSQRPPILPKPYTREQLAAAVRARLGGRQDAAAPRSLEGTRARGHEGT